MSAATESASTAHVFQLDETLDPQALRGAFSERGRLLISRVLRDSDAQALHLHLSREIDWGLLVGARGDERMSISPDKYRQMNAAQQREVLAIAYGNEGLGGAHMFGCRLLEKSAADGAITLLARFAEFLNSHSFLDFVREVTGLEHVNRIAASAACYRPGHFYGFHVDESKYGKQEGALVYYLSPGWMHQWGGMLQFRNSDGEFAEAFFPRFNSLSIFLTGQQHAVSCISPFASMPRYSIAGRLME